MKKYLNEEINEHIFSNPHPMTANDFAIQRSHGTDKHGITFLCLELYGCEAWRSATKI